MKEEAQDSSQESVWVQILIVFIIIVLTIIYLAIKTG